MIESKSKARDKSVGTRVLESFKLCLKPAFKTIRWLLMLMIPVSFGVMLLDYSGFLFWLAGYTEPFVRALGLRGEAALVLLSGAILNIYSAIAVLQSISFSVREITIIALMCLIAHNLIVETAVQKKTGSSAITMVILRVAMAIVGGYLLNLILPGEAFSGASSLVRPEKLPFLETLFKWLVDTAHLIIKVVIILVGLNFLHKVMDEFSINKWLARFMAPILRLFGLPRQASFLWLIANVIGLAWGSAVLIEESSQGRISAREVDILNHHIAISHSLLEDTLLFIAVGAITLWIIVPRLVLAFIVVWIYRFVYRKQLK